MRVVPPDVPVVAILGDPGQGKDTAFRDLYTVMARRQLRPARYAFADCLKVATSVLYPSPPTAWSDRSLLNAMGDAARMVDEDTFVKLVANKIRADFEDTPLDESSVYEVLPTPDMVVITDARFPNEFDWLDAQGAEYVVLCRDAAPYYLTPLEAEHPSAHTWRRLVKMHNRVANYCPNHTHDETKMWWCQFLDTMGWFDARDYYRSHGKLASGFESLFTD